MTTDANETPKPKPETTTKPKPKPVKPPRKTSILTPVLLGVMLGALGYGGYWVWQYSQGLTTQLTSYQQQLASQQQAIAELTQRQQTLATELQQQPQRFANDMNTLERTVANQQQALDQQALSVAAVASEFANFDLSQTSGWRIIEARNLADLAGRKLWLDGDIEDAITLLKLADSHLEVLNNPAYLTIRQALSDDIATLELLEVAPVDEIAMRIASLQKSVSTIDWQPQAQPSVAEPTTMTTDWWENLKRSGRSLLDHFIRIERREQPVEPMLANDFVRVIKERLQLQLQLAQSAVLQGHDELYQSALADAQTLLQNYAPTTSTELNRVLTQLAELRTYEFKQQRPEQLSALPLLQRQAAAVSGEDS